MLKKNELTEYRTLLLSLQTRLRGDVQHLADGALHRADGDGDSKSPTHIAELGTDNYEQDFSLRFVENEQEILDEISLALKKIDTGTYGLCEKCLEQGKPPAKSVIIKERLKAIPYVRTCVHCAEQQRTRKWRRQARSAILWCRSEDTSASASRERRGFRWRVPAERGSSI